MNREHVSLSLMGAKTRQITVLLTTSRVWTDVVRAEVISLKRRETPGNVLLSVFEQSLETNHVMILARLVVDENTGQQHYHPMRDYDLEQIIQGRVAPWLFGSPDMEIGGGDSLAQALQGRLGQIVIVDLVRKHKTYRFLSGNIFEQLRLEPARTHPGENQAFYASSSVLGLPVIQTLDIHEITQGEGIPLALSREANHILLLVLTGSHLALELQHQCEKEAYFRVEKETDLSLEYSLNSAWPIMESHLKMPHQRCYDSCRCCCNCVGSMFYFLDPIGGLLFILGSICFLLPPALRVSGNGVGKVASDSIFILGMVLLTLGKFVLESKAAYSETWQIPSLRAGPSYHMGIIFFFFGGFAFLANLILDLKGVAYISAIAGLVSGILFSFGSIFLLMNAFEAGSVVCPVFKWTNLVLTGNISLAIGSVLYWIQGWVLICMVQYPDQVNPGVYSLQHAAYCNAALNEWISLFGGVFFTLGSLCNWLFGLYELITRYKRFGGAFDS